MMSGIFEHRRTVKFSVRCPCGTNTSVIAGGAVTCACGRRWDTGRLPESDLRGLDRVVVRSRRTRLAFLAKMVLVVGALVFVGRSAPLPVSVAAFGLVWWKFCRPWWRQRRQSQRMKGLPSWELRPSSGGSE